MEIKINDDIIFSTYSSELVLDSIIALVEKDLSEPYSIFTYRYFVNQWPQLCEMAHNSEGELIGVIVCKVDKHKKSEKNRGYIGMLAVDKRYRNRGIASSLVQSVLKRMQQQGLDECVLEAEITNKGALSLYQNLGFLRTKLLPNYYLSGTDAFRLKYFFTPLV